MYSYHGTEYLGAAHGLSGILQMLLSVPGFLTDHPSGPAAAQYIRTSVDYLLSLQTPNGNFPTAMDEVVGGYSRRESDELIHWCHGAPGTVYLMARAYVIWKDEKYLESVAKSGECVWQKGLLKKGPGLCHGVSGSGYVFLLLYRLTKDLKYLNRAKQFAEFMFSDKFKEARSPDAPYSLYEGLAGTACYLVDLMQPDRAAFPFFDIFDY